MFGMAGQEERNGYCAIFSWNEYVALCTEVGKGALIALPFFAFVTECLISGLSFSTKDANLKMEQFLFPLTGPALDRTRPRDLQPIVGG